jgi:hypothetical protein
MSEAENSIRNEITKVEVAGSMFLFYQLKIHGWHGSPKARHIEFHVCNVCQLNFLNEKWLKAIARTR